MGLTKQDLYQMGELDVDIYHSSEVTVAHVVGAINGKEYVWTGHAKRSYEDDFDSEAGAKIALGRALEKAGRQLLRQGEGRVKSNFDNRSDSVRKRRERQANAGSTAVVKITRTRRNVKV